MSVYTTDSSSQTACHALSSDIPQREAPEKSKTLSPGIPDEPGVDRDQKLMSQEVPGCVTTEALSPIYIYRWLADSP